MRWIQESESEEQFLAYRKAVGEVMGDLYFKLLEPLYEQYPDIIPKTIR